jgi:hypothetical protein
VRAELRDNLAIHKCSLTVSSDLIVFSKHDKHNAFKSTDASLFAQDVLLRYEVEINVYLCACMSVCWYIRIYVPTCVSIYLRNYVFVSPIVYFTQF